MFTGRSWMEDGAAAYAVVWKRGEAWMGIKSHLGCNQEAYDTECGALARTLESVARRNTPPERVTVFSDAQAANKRMASDELRPGMSFVRPDASPIGAYSPVPFRARFS